MPLIAGLRQPAADLVGEGLAELERPLPNRLVADRDATGGEDLVDMAQAQREAEIEPDGAADDLGREPVAGVGRLGGWRAHSGRLLGRNQPAKPGPS